MNSKQARRVRKMAKVMGVSYKAAKKAFKRLNHQQNGAHTEAGRRMNLWK